MPLFNYPLGTSTSTTTQQQGTSLTSGRLHLAASLAELPAIATPGDIAQFDGDTYVYSDSEWELYSGKIATIIVPTIADRDQLYSDSLQIGTIARVDDASADPSVDSGWAEYLCIGISPNAWSKSAEAESLDPAEVNDDEASDSAPYSGAKTEQVVADAVADGTDFDSDAILDNLSIHG